MFSLFLLYKIYLYKNILFLPFELLILSNSLCLVNSNEFDIIIVSLSLFSRSRSSISAS